MKTLTAPAKADYKQSRVIVEINDVKIVRLVFVRGGRILTIPNLEDGLQMLPGFDLKDDQPFARQVQRFSQTQLGVQVNGLCDPIGPIFFDPGSADVDYYEIRIVTPQFRVLVLDDSVEWIKEREIFSRVGYLSRLCISEYWHS